MTDEDLPPRGLVVDAMLGRLARWCRLAGIDTLYDPAMEDDALLGLALRERRLLVTRDRVLTARARKAGVPVLDPGTEDWTLQFVRVCRTLGTPPETLDWFGRCVDCNAAVEEVAPASVRLLVPEYVYRRRRKFYQCPLCGKIFWPGTHYRAVDRRRRRLEEVWRRLVHEPEGEVD